MWVFVLQDFYSIHILLEDIFRLFDILISIGTNDIDIKEPGDIIEEYVDIVEILQNKYPQSQFLINELSPQKEQFDNKGRRYTFVEE